jgi:hypothetical protein
MSLHEKHIHELMSIVYIELFSSQAARISSERITWVLTIWYFSQLRYRDICTHLTMFTCTLHRDFENYFLNKIRDTCSKVDLRVLQMIMHVHVLLIHEVLLYKWVL